MRRHCDASYVLDDEANPSVAADAMRRLLALERSLHHKTIRAPSARRALHRVESALGRIGLGTWGRCLSCGKRIDDARLRAHPEVEDCRECGTH